MKVIIEVHKDRAYSNRYFFKSNGRTYIFYKDEVKPIRKFNLTKAVEQIQAEYDACRRLVSNKSLTPDEAYQIRTTIKTCISIINQNIKSEE
jgi:hypothetical protein